MTLTLTLFLVPALALLLTAVLTPQVRRAAVAAGAVAGVRPDRWHRKATPAIGGLAIFLGFGGAVVVGTVLSPEIGSTLRAGRGGLLGLSHWQALLAAGGILFLVGMIDDLVQLQPMTKLGGQLLGAGVLVLSEIGVWITGIYVVDVLVSLLWFVGVTNAMNLLDNMDGLAAGTGAIAGGILAALLLLDGEVGVAALALALSGSLVGFLAHNYTPARIFMGDSGSLFLGIILAGLALAPAPGLSRSLFAVLAVPAAILAVPLLDTTFVTVQRLLEGRPVSQGGRDHTSHGLVSLGVSEERAVWILWGLALVGGFVGLLLRTVERALAGVLGGVLLVALALLGAYLLSVKHRVEEEMSERPAMLYHRILAFHERVPLFSFLLDIVLVGLAYYAAYLIRWDPGEIRPELAYFRSTVALVVVAKVLTFASNGIYRTRWRHFGLEDALRVLRASLLASVVTAALLLLFQRVGLSRGVLLIDFFVCSTLVLGARFSFRLIEGTTRGLSGGGRPVVLVGSAEDAELALRMLSGSSAERLRPVAVADAVFGGRRGRLRGYPLFGGKEALHRAIRETGAHAVVVVRRSGERGEASAWRPPYTVRDHLEAHGGLDVYVLSIGVSRWKGSEETEEPIRTLGPEA